MRFLKASRLQSHPTHCNKVHSKQENESDTGQVRLNRFGSIYITSESEFGDCLGSIMLSPLRRYPISNGRSSNGVRQVGQSFSTIWECRELRILNSVDLKTLSSLMAASFRFMREFEIKTLVTSLDEHTMKFLETTHSLPYITEENGLNKPKERMAIWQYREIHYQEWLRLAGMSLLEMELYFANEELGMETPAFA